MPTFFKTSRLAVSASIWLAVALLIVAAGTAGSARASGATGISSKFVAVGDDSTFVVNDSRDAVLRADPPDFVKVYSAPRNMTISRMSGGGKRLAIEVKSASGVTRVFSHDITTGISRTLARPKAIGRCALRSALMDIGDDGTIAVGGVALDTRRCGAQLQCLQTYLPSEVKAKCVPLDTRRRLRKIAISGAVAASTGPNFLEVFRLPSHSTIWSSRGVTAMKPATKLLDLSNDMRVLRLATSMWQGRLRQHLSISTKGSTLNFAVPIGGISDAIFCGQRAFVMVRGSQITLRELNANGTMSVLHETDAMTGRMACDEDKVSILHLADGAMAISNVEL